VLDFGLVKQLGRIDGLDGKESTLQALTRDDSFAGTPLYMAPEAITSPDAVDARTDLYSLGAVGYFLLSGQHVFTGRNVVEICSHHLHSIPPPPSQRLGESIPSDLEQLILACLEKTPEKRPADARKLQAALRACSDARTWSEDDARLWFAAHAQALRERKAHEKVPGAATIAVDLDLRRPA